MGVETNNRLKFAQKKMGFRETTYNEKDIENISIVLFLAFKEIEKHRTPFFENQFPNKIPKIPPY